VFAIRADCRGVILAALIVEAVSHLMSMTTSRWPPKLTAGSMVKVEEWRLQNAAGKLMSFIRRLVVGMTVGGVIVHSFSSTGLAQLASWYVAAEDGSVLDVADEVVAFHRERRVVTPFLSGSRFYFG